MRRSGERGSAIIEMAIASTILMFVMFAVMEFGHALYVYNVVANGARLGARYAIVRGGACTFADCPATSASIQTYVRGISPNIDTTQLTVTATWATAGACTATNYPSKNGPGCIVTVTAKYPVAQLLWFQPMSMQSTSQMYISH